MSACGYDAPMDTTPEPSAPVSVTLRLDPRVARLLDVYCSMRDRSRSNAVNRLLRAVFDYAGTMTLENMWGSGGDTAEEIERRSDVIFADLVENIAANGPLGIGWAAPPVPQPVKDDD
jgi:hypothetical protein